jgi:hypothetical protein
MWNKLQVLPLPNGCICAISMAHVWIYDLQIANRDGIVDPISATYWSSAMSVPHLLHFGRTLDRCKILLLYARHILVMDITWDAAASIPSISKHFYAVPSSPSPLPMANNLKLEHYTPIMYQLGKPNNFCLALLAIPSTRLGKDAPVYLYQTGCTSRATTPDISTGQ